MRISLNQQGSSHLVIFLGIAVVAAIGIVGFRVVNSDQATTKSLTAVVKKAESPATLKSTADVKQATSEIDATNIDSDVNPDQLDSDINSIQ